MRQRLLTDPLRLIAAAVFLVFILYYGLCCFRAVWGGDFQMYCAGVSQLYRDFLHPAHEAMNVPGDQSTVYTPYLVLVAALGRLLGATPYRALQFAGLINLLVYLIAVGYFVSRFSMHRRASLAAASFLLVTLFVRWKHFGWSSETSVLTMQFVQSYPSTIGWALALFAFGLVEDFRRSRRPGLLIGLGAVLCLLLLTHVITATWVIGIMGLRALYVLVGERDWRLPLQLAAAIAAALGVAVLWPYSAFFGQSSMTEVREPSRFGEHPFIDFLNLYLVALPCAIWAIARVRRHAFIALAFLATFIALEVWRAAGISFGNRYSFFMAFWAQFLVAEAAAAGVLAIAGKLDETSTDLPVGRRYPRVDRPLTILLLVAAALSWFASPMWQEARKRSLARLSTPSELWRGTSPVDRYYSQFDGLARHLGPEDVAIMPVSRTAFDLASITGAQIVSSPNAHRVPDARIRERDMGRFFSDRATAQTRLEFARRYGATKVLLLRKQFRVLRTMEQLFGPPLYRDGNHALFDSSKAGRMR